MSVPLLGACELPGSFICKECGSSIKAKRDEHGAPQALYHGTGGRPKTKPGEPVAEWKDARVETICLDCGDRVLQKTNCIDRVYLKQKHGVRATPSDVASDPTLVVLKDIECPAAACPTRQPPPPGELAKPNRVAVDQPDEKQLKPRYTCLYCKHQWMLA